MKVALLVPGGVDRSGEERVIPVLLWLIERLARVHELHVIAMRQEPRTSRYELLGAQVHNVGSRPRRPRALFTLVSEHRRRPFDILHAVWAAPPGVLAALAGRLLGVPVLLHLTGGDLADLPDIGFGLCQNRRGRMWLHLAVRGAARITVPSGAMQRLAAARGLPAAIVTYGVALNRWLARRPQPRSPDRAARLLHVGTLNRVKDHQTLLRAARSLQRGGVAFHLDIVGEDILNGEVQRFAAECGVASRVTFHGFLTHGRLRPLVEQADVLVVSSRHEADPIVTLEAAVAGVPTVGTAVGHIADWAPQAALAVPVGDADRLARAVRELLVDEPRRLRVAEEAYRRATASDADRTAQRVLALYAELSHTRAAGR